MNWVDIAIIFVIAVTSLYSFMWGFIRQLLLMVCFGVGLYVALTYNGWVYEQFTKGWVDSETIAKVVAGGLLFVGSFILASILTIPLFRLVRSRIFKFLDHLTGLFFGFAPGRGHCRDCMDRGGADLAAGGRPPQRQQFPAAALRPRRLALPAQRSRAGAIYARRRIAAAHSRRMGIHAKC